jgi:hypothetical protein
MLGLAEARGIYGLAGERLEKLVIHRPNRRTTQTRLGCAARRLDLLVKADMPKP